MINLALSPIKTTGGTTKRTFSARFSDIINVKDYGATGDGSTDDRTAIQAAFDAAFGTQGSPHGNANKFLNKPVFFPAGNYIVGGPLYLTAVFGGHIFGAGSQSTRIAYSGSFSGNTVVANGITPVIMMEMNYSRIEGLNIAISDNNSVGIYLFGKTVSCNANVFYDLLMEGGTDGILVAYQTVQTAVSECFYIDVTFSNCTFAGLRVADQNALNHWVYGGGGASCGNGGYGTGSAAYSVSTGSIPIICGSSLAGNLLDIYNGGSVPMALSGIRTESFQFAQIDGSYATITACQVDHASSTLIVAAGSASIIVMDGNRFDGTAAIITGSSGSKIYLRGNAVVNAAYLASYTGLVAALDIPNGVVSALPAANDKYKGLGALVTDANSITFMAAAVGGGSNIVPVRCIGSGGWKIA